MVLIVEFNDVIRHDKLTFFTSFFLSSWSSFSKLLMFSYYWKISIDSCISFHFAFHIILGNCLSVHYFGRTVIYWCMRVYLSWNTLESSNKLLVNSWSLYQNGCFLETLGPRCMSNKNRVVWLISLFQIAGCGDNIIPMIIISSKIDLGSVGWSYF